MKHGLFCARFGVGVMCIGVFACTPPPFDDPVLTEDDIFFGDQESWSPPRSYPGKINLLTRQSGGIVGGLTDAVLVQCGTGEYIRFEPEDFNEVDLIVNDYAFSNDIYSFDDVVHAVESAAIVKTRSSIAKDDALQAAFCGRYNN